MEYVVNKSSCWLMFDPIIYLLEHVLLGWSLSSLIAFMMGGYMVFIGLGPLFCIVSLPLGKPPCFLNVSTSMLKLQKTWQNSIVSNSSLNMQQKRSGKLKKQMEVINTKGIYDNLGVDNYHDKHSFISQNSKKLWYIQNLCLILSLMKMKY